jgi:uncharacterized membrane protein
MNKGMHWRTYVVAAAIGTIAGLRSLTAPAIVSRCARKGDLPLGGTPLEFLGTEGASKTLTVLAASEIVADQLPFIPARTDPPSLAARVLAGGLCGAAICAANDKPAAIGAVVGGAAALCGTFGAFHLRRGAVHELGVPDLVVALIEDAVAVGGGTAALAVIEPRTLTASPRI